MKDNRGFTLVELIVVIIIMGILAVGSTSIARLLDRGNTKSTTERIMTMLDYVQSQNLTKSRSYNLEIVQEPSGKYKAIVVAIASDGVSEEEVLSEILKLRSGSIGFHINQEAQILVDESQKLVISFRKDNGGLREYSTGKYVSKIVVTAPGSEQTIHIVAITGKHYIE